MTKGKKEHDKFKEKVAKKEGWMPNPQIIDRTKGKKLIPDAISKQGRPVELKPNTASGRKAGAKQLKKYEEALGKKGRVIYYDPKSST